MTAVAFRNNLTRLLLDARKVDWKTEETDPQGEQFGDSVPTPAEIRERCLAIQAEWSPQERAKRAGYYGQLSTWTPPVVTVGEMD